MILAMPVNHLALVQEPTERLGEVDHAQIMQDLGEEAGVQQM